MEIKKFASRENAKLVAQMIIIVNRVKNVMINLVLILVKMEFAQKICTVTLMKEFAFHHANLIRVVLVVIDASTAIVCNLARMTANVQTVNNIVTSKHKKHTKSC